MAATPSPESGSDPVPGSGSVPTAGIHHVTAICGDAQRTVDFYARVLGLRFLKRTVNFDDPSTYHLYFGDRVGHPGTALTFFAWRHLPQGRPGAGQAVRVAFKVPEGSLDAWLERLESPKWGERFPDWTPGERELSEIEERFGRRTLRLRDPDGLGLALVEREAVDSELQWIDRPAGEEPAGQGPVPLEMAIAGFHGVILAETELEPTAEVLVDVLGFEEVDQEDEDVLFVARAGGGWGEPGKRAGDRSGELGPRDTVVEVEAAPDSAAGRVAGGSIHHVAYRAAGEEHQEALRSRARGAGLGPTPVIDRFYFRSVYFREPGGVLFEVATDGPGFTRDQEPEELGSRELTLPPWLEERRAMIESHLPPVEPPEREGGSGEAGEGGDKETKRDAKRDAKRAAEKAPEKADENEAEQAKASETGR